MNDEEKTEEMARLLALKAYERPDGERVEKSVQDVMRAVREANSRPSLHFFPDKSLGWMFAQPRYGIAAMFILFLGLHLLYRPIPQASIDAAVVEVPSVMDPEFLAVAETNSSTLQVSPVPTIPSYSQPDYSSLLKPASFTQ